jgi:hypothetical protein
MGGGYRTFFDNGGDRGWNGLVIDPLPGFAPRSAPSAGSISPARRRLVAAALLVAAVVVYATAPPIGGAASWMADGDMAARGQAMRGGFDPQASALWLLAVQASRLFPLHDMLARTHLVSLLAGGLVASMVLWRLLSGIERDPAAGPARGGRRADREQADVHATDGEAGGRVESAPAALVAAVLATVTVALSHAFFASATRAGPAALAAALALGALLLAERVARAPADGRAGLGLALLAGLAAGGPLAAAALTWPPAWLLSGRALRRGERWPLLAPVVFVAGTGITLLLFFRAPGHAARAELGGHLLLLPVLRGLAALSPHALAGALAALVEELGVLAVLVAAVGLLSTRGLGLVFTLWPLALGLALRAGLGSGTDASVATMAASYGLALPLAHGILRLAEPLGRARVPAAGALGVILAVWPLLAR